MSEPQVRSGCVELLDARQLRLVEAAAPGVSPDQQLAMDRVWDEAVRANPTGLFDGPVVVCAGVEWDSPGSLVLFWAGVTYRRFALRWVQGAAAVSSIFVAVVQPTDEGGVLVGRMSSSTAAPGRWQCPGGSVEPPEDEESLGAAELRRQAARELVEETGIDTAPEDLTLWVVTRGEYGNVGIFFRAPSLPESVVRELFAALVSAETALGRIPELEEIALVGSPAELAGLGGPHGDYLEPIVRRYAEALPRRDT